MTPRRNRPHTQIMEPRIEHEDNPQHGAFYMQQDGKRIAELTYVRAKDALIVIDHTGVEPELRGKGVGRQLLLAAVDWARKNSLRVKPSCSFAVAHFARDPSIRDVLAPNM
ncbi:MAG: GNAT family N-acetyltransferase [Pseudomonadota bacterium]